MVLFLRRKKLQQMLSDIYSKGLTIGYKLGYQSGKIDKAVGDRMELAEQKVKREIAEILEKNGF